jgi:type III secretion protein J
VSPQKREKMRFSQLSPRLSPLALIAAVLCAFILGGCRSDLYTGLDERQANEMVSTLLRRRIYATRTARQDNLFAVAVDESDFARAVQVLNEHGLPRQNFSNLGEVFKNEGLVKSPAEEKAKWIYGLSQELSKSISEMDGVLSARVHIVLPENDPLRQQSIPSSASVFIRHQASAPITDRIPQVKMLVANGISGLTYDKVSVSLVPVENTHEEEADDLVLFWGLWIKKESIGWASWLLYGLIASVVGLAAALVYITVRSMRKVYKLPVTAEAKAR